jgi:hypothetical protein
MMTGRVKGTAFAFLLFGAAGARGGPAVAAQERNTECRCVDRDGTELENCVCVRTPRMDRIVMAPWGAAQDRPRLGISLDISAQAEAVGGARISGVLDDGPAARAGLREGDVVTRVDGRSLTEPLDADRERGSTWTARFRRKGCWPSRASSSRETASISSTSGTASPAA